MTDDEFILVCAPADAPLEIPGTTYSHRCSRCSRQLQLAPDGQRTLREKPEAKLICCYCFMADKTPGRVIMPPTMKQRADIATARPNTWRRRN